MSRKISLLCLVLMFLSLGVIAQETKQKDKKPKRDWNSYLDLGVGLAQHRIRDEATSPLRYTGRLLSSYGAFLNEHEDMIWKIYGGFSYGKIDKSIGGSTYQGTAYNGFAGASFLMGIDKWSSERFRLYAGVDAMWAGDFRVNFNFQNASYNYNLTTGIGPSAIVHYNFGWKARSFSLWFMNFNRKERHLKISHQFNLPLFFHYIQPEYSVISDFTDGNNEASGFDNPQTSFIGDVYRFNSRTELYYYFHNENALKLGYAWDFTKVKGENFTVDSSHHYFILSLLIRLSPTIPNAVE